MPDTKGRDPVEEQDQNTNEQIEHEKQVQQEPDAQETAPAQAENEEYKPMYLRALADYRNLESRMFKERQEITKRCKADAVSAFLPVLENLDKAELFIKDPGLKMIKDQFMQTMEMLGVKELPLEGKPFDPHTAEAIEVIEGEKDDMVVEVVRKAYEMGGTVIQHGQVKVSKKSK